MALPVVVQFTNQAGAGSATFENRGALEPGASGGSGASLTKVGNNALILSSPNYYTGGTTINSGSINLQTRRGSATGPGPVQINAGGSSVASAPLPARSRSGLTGRSHRATSGPAA